MLKPRLMGILNVTPDSFYAESRFPDISSAIERGKILWQQGADLIDVGGESTRPGAVSLSEAEELDRVLPVVQALSQVIPVRLSIDTCKPSVADACVRAGASLINDIHGFRDPLMREVAASTGVDVCIMHMQGTPQTMQQQPSYPEGVIEHLLRWFEHQVGLLQRAGVQQERILLDPGIGFGKTVAHNVEILQNLPRFRAIGYPLLLGVSRKSFMGRILGKATRDLLPATLAVNALILKDGVAIIRVHDVAEHRDIIDLLYAMEQWR